MIVPPGIDQVKLGSQRGGNGFRIVAHDRQPAAPFGAVRSEGCDDHVTTGPHGLFQPSHVCIAVRRLRQKMEGGAIVPEVIRVRRLPGGDVRDDPVDSVSATAEPLLRFLESLCGKVEYRYPAESLLKEAINKS
jgi:hypothetical protein